MSNSNGTFLYNNLNQEHLNVIEPIRSRIPVDIIKICTNLGVILKKDLLPTDVSGAIRKEHEGVIIYYDITESTNRQRFTIAHELSHFLLGHLESNEYLAENILLRSNRLSNTQERDANYLASELLMPMEQIDMLTNNNALTIKDLADTLQVSEMALSVRLGIS